MHVNAFAWIAGMGLGAGNVWFYAVPLQAPDQPGRCALEDDGSTALGC